MHRTTVQVRSTHRTPRQPGFRVPFAALAALSAALGCGSDGAADRPEVPPFQGSGEPATESGTSGGEATPPDGNEAATSGDGVSPEGAPADVPLVGGEAPASEGTPAAEAPAEPPPAPAPPGVLGYPENTGAFCEVTAGAYGGDNPNLPNPFARHDGTIIGSVADWTCRRNEIKKDLEEFEIGVKPVLLGIGGARQHDIGVMGAGIAVAALIDDEGAAKTGHVELISPQQIE